MADVMRELERLRPVYETGVLRLLLRQNAMLYVSLLPAFHVRPAHRRAAARDRGGAVRAKSEQSGRRRRVCAARGPDLRQAAHQILADLTREGEGDYAWLANSHDAASHRFLYRLTARALVNFFNTY